MRGQRKDAYDQYDKSVAEGNFQAEDFNNIGSMLADRGLLDDANKYFLQALKVSPGSKSANMNLTNLYLSKGDFDSALYHLRIALRYNPQDPQIRERIQLVVNQIRQAEEEAAKKQTAKAHVRNPIENQPSQLEE